MGEALPIVSERTRWRPGQARLADCLVPSGRQLASAVSSRGVAPQTERRFPLLSDGYPNRGKITQPAKILEAVRALNAGRVIIDAVALGESPGELLPALTKENGGKFVSCPFAK